MSRFARSSSAPWRRVGEDVLVAPAGRDDFDQLSGTAAVVWRILEAPSSLADLVANLSEMYSVPTESIASEVGALVTDLTRRGAIEEIPCGP